MPDQFEDALKAGKQTDWYDDALFYYAEWMNSYGTVRPLEDGQLQTATRLRESTRALSPSATRVFAKARLATTTRHSNRSKNITEPALSIGVSNIFLPGSELQFGLNARNVQPRRFCALQIRHDARRAFHRQ